MEESATHRLPSRSRRIAVTVPNFMFALAVIADTDLIAALPRRFVAMHAARFGVVGVKAPLPLTTFRLNVVASRRELIEQGISNEHLDFIRGTVQRKS